MLLIYIYSGGLSDMNTRLLLFFSILAFYSASLVAKLPPSILDIINVCYLYPAGKESTIKPTTTIPELFTYINKKEIVPTQATIAVAENKSNPIWGFKKGLPQGLNTPIFINSGPRNDVMGRFFHGGKGNGVRCTNPWIKHAIVNVPMVTFDYFYDKEFDFGQGINLNCLNNVYVTLSRQNPNAPIIMAATCIGAKIALEYAVNYQPTNMAAMILESPFIDANKLFTNLQKSYSHAAIPLSVESVLKWYFPDAKAALSRPHADISKIRSNMPIFITHRFNDTYCSNQEFKELVDQLRASGNKDIYLLVLQDNKHSHGHLNNIPEFSLAANAFLAKYNLPHDRDKAQKGFELLQMSLNNAQANSVDQWTVIKA